MAHYLLLITGWISVLLAAVGAALPLIPTTPFLIVAAFCFARSSPALHQWLMELPTLGPILQQWEEHRVIPRRAKLLATLIMWSMIGSSIVFGDLPRAAIIGLIVTACTVSAYILTRPSSARGSAS